jgi:hypothetical protein
MNFVGKVYRLGKFEENFLVMKWCRGIKANIAIQSKFKMGCQCLNFGVCSMQHWNQFLLLFIVRQDQREMEKICMIKKWGESRRVSWKVGGIIYVKWCDFKINDFKIRFFITLEINLVIIYNKRN